MKNRIFTIVTIVILTCTSGFVKSQTQLDIQGTTNNNSDPVVIIDTRSTTGTSIGLTVKAITSPSGVAGSFIGSLIGVSGQGFNVGVAGSTETGAGVKGSSRGGFGGYFVCTDKTKPDLVIGGTGNNNPGDDGIISSDPLYPGSDLFLRSNDAVVVELDQNGDEDGHLEVRNGDSDVVFKLGESGNAQLNSNIANDYARLRMKNIDNDNFWDIAGGGVDNSELNFFRINVGNVLQLHASGDPLTTETGAFLSSGGMWINNSSKTLKTLEQAIVPNSILSIIGQLPIYYWRYLAEPQTLHLGPVAEDFHALFGCGPDNTHLAPSDLAAVALSAAQALLQKNVELEKRMAKQEQIIEVLLLEFENFKNNNSENYEKRN